MNRIILALGLSFACSLLVHAQKVKSSSSADASNQTSATVNQGNKSIALNSGTRLAGELQNTVDVRRAKVGDQVLLKTTQALKSNGHTVVAKGSRLVGHVTEVAQKTKENDESRVGIIFDRLEQGTLQMPIVASISSITSGNASARSGNDDLFASDNSVGESARASSSRSSSSGGGGGLLGGVGSTVNSTTSTAGGLVGNTTSAVGSTVNSTTGAVGNTASGIGRSFGGIQISESSNTSVEGSSVLSLQGNNLRLEKGTNFNLVLTQSASAGTSRNQ